MGYSGRSSMIMRSLRENNREGPIHMLKLVRLREQAASPDDRKSVRRSSAIWT